MEYQEVVKKSFVLIGYGAAGKWEGDWVYPIPSLWDRAASFIGEEGVDKIVGVCLPPRSDHYFYICGIELDSVDFNKIEEDMVLHTFPEQKYVVFTHRGNTDQIPATYGKIWREFDRKGYRIKAGMPEIESVRTDLFGKEESNEYEMEIWIPVE
ncbi:GyrI-like domain-containing protein [Fictibacillus nanhaiensis]|uniref:GyrI-like domain-containing protein n=1 Tax=Fictibacillus nanhaiensis TaxID=742169 RepID=A0ABS2ZS47_9BACL|nr:GyrI-like domain-containing protein [Fictibacillus nanhaiensis]